MREIRELEKQIIEVRNDYNDFVRQRSAIYDDLPTKCLVDDGTAFIIIDTSFDYISKNGEVKLDYTNLQTSINEYVSLVA